jgi:hypothetical protein
VRDANRISGVLAAVEALWRANPDQRLGQLIFNIAGRDPFFIEDDELVRRAALHLEEGW